MPKLNHHFSSCILKGIGTSPAMTWLAVACRKMFTALAVSGHRSPVNVNPLVSVQFIFSFTFIAINHQDIWRKCTRHSTGCEHPSIKTNNLLFTSNVWYHDGYWWLMGSSKVSMNFLNRWNRTVFVVVLEWLHPWGLASSVHVYILPWDAKTRINAIRCSHMIIISSILRSQDFSEFENISVGRLHSLGSRDSFSNTEAQETGAKTPRGASLLLKLCYTWASLSLLFSQPERFAWI